MPMNRTIISTTNLTKYFPVQRGFLERVISRKLEYIRAVDGVDLEIREEETLALVGETGCGKTTTGRLLVRLLEPTGGDILFRGKRITHVKGEELRKLRRHLQIIFQDPYASLNPRMKIGDAIGHPLEIHDIAKGKEKRQMVLEMLEKVGLTPAERYYELYPHQLSGGERQRVAISRAMILKPDFIVADEPISMIDVSLRAKILELMADLKKEFHVTYLFITHDLATAKYVSDRIAVMYLGKIVELATTDELFSNPLHPYVKALISAIPRPGPKVKRERLLLKGEIPSPINPPSGCRLHPRCPFKMQICSKEEPKLLEKERGHYVACHLY